MAAPLNLSNQGGSTAIDLGVPQPPGSMASHGVTTVGGSGAGGNDNFAFLNFDEHQQHSSGEKTNFSSFFGEGESKQWAGWLNAAQGI